MHLFLQILLVAILSFFFNFFLQSWRRRNERENVLPRPPGPLGLPIIGNLHQFVSPFPHLYFHELSKIYGPLLSLKLGSVPILVVSSAELAKQVLKTQDLIFCNRPKLATLQKLSYGGLDISFAPYGEHWRQFKKVSLIHLFSHKKVRSFAPFREEEVRQMTQIISRLCDEDRVVDLSDMVVCLTNTIICKIAFGRIYDSGGLYARCGRSFQDMLKDVDEMLITFCFSDFFPYMGWVLDNLTGMSTSLHKVYNEFDEFYEKIIDQHLNSITTKDGQEDIVDVLLGLQRDTSLGVNITKDHIKGILMDLVEAFLENDGLDMKMFGSRARKTTPTSSERMPRMMRDQGRSMREAGTRSKEENCAKLGHDPAEFRPESKKCTQDAIWEKLGHDPAEFLPEFRNPVEFQLESRGQCQLGETRS